MEWTVRVVGTRHWAFIELLTIKLRTQLDAGPSSKPPHALLTPPGTGGVPAGVVAAGHGGTSTATSTRSTPLGQLVSTVRSAWHIVRWQHECGIAGLCDWVSDFAVGLTAARALGLRLDAATQSHARMVLTRCASQAKVEYGDTNHELETSLSVALAEVSASELEAADAASDSLVLTFA